MEYNNSSNNWYEAPKSDSQPAAAPEPQPAAAPAQKKKASVSVTALVACMLATALLGGALGGVIGHFAGGKGSSKAAEPAAAVVVAEQPTAATAPAQEQAVTVPAGAGEQQDAEAQANTAAAPSLTSLLTQSSATGGLTRAQVVEACAPSVVGIDVEYQTSTPSGYGYFYYYGYGSGQSSTSTASGSGVVVTSDGYIVTCNHVVEGATKITVVLSDESEYEATLVGTDERYDLAVIKIDASGLTPAVLGDSDMLTVGEDVVAIGNHLGELRGTATGGMVSALNRKVTVENVNMSLIQHDAAVSPGSSGGGLFNSSGSLIGIVNAKASSNNAEGIGFAIPVNDVKSIISDIIERGYVTGRAYLGVYIQNVTLQSDRGSRRGYGSVSSCVQISQVVAGGAAEKAGLQSGDFILYVDDTQITGTDSLSSAINRYNAGDTAKLIIQRSGEQMEISVTFGEYAPER